MFEFLNKANKDDVLGAASFAVRALREGGAFSVLISPDELTPSQLELGKQILSAIESNENQPVGQLDSAQLEKYIGELYSLVDKKTGGRDSHTVEANRVLADFRRSLSLLASSGQIRQRQISKATRR